MRKIFKVLGMVMMFLAGIGFLVTLICSIPMAKDLEMSLLGNIGIILCMLLMFFGLFSVGRLLFQFGSRPPKASSVKPSLSVPPIKSSAALRRTGSSSAKTGSGSTIEASAPAASPSSPAAQAEQRISLGELQLMLYRNDSARAEASRGDGDAVPELLQLVCREDKIVLILETVQLGELFSGSMYRAERLEQSLPASMLPGISPDSLISWAEKTYPILRNQDWVPHADHSGLEEFCRLLRMTTTEQSCRNVYITSAPFPILNEPRSDPMQDASGVETWLAMRDHASVDQALNEALKFACIGKTVLLAPDPGMLFGVSAAKRRELEKAPLLIGFLQGKDQMLDLLTRRYYRVEIETVQGSADEDAGCGRWQLKERKKHADP